MSGLKYNLEPISLANSFQPQQWLAALRGGRGVCAECAHISGPHWFAASALTPPLPAQMLFTRAFQTLAPGIPLSPSKSGGTVRTMTTRSLWRFPALARLRKRISQQGNHVSIRIKQLNHLLQPGKCSFVYTEHVFISPEISEFISPNSKN